MTITVLVYNLDRIVVGVHIFHNLARAQRFIDRVSRDRTKVAVVDEVVR